jgi:hypothetical protein
VLALQEQVKTQIAQARNQLLGPTLRNMKELAAGTEKPTLRK